jgi:hypothetical protein
LKRIWLRGREIAKEGQRSEVRSSYEAFGLSRFSLLPSLSPPPSLPLPPSTLSPSLPSLSPSLPLSLPLFPSFPQILLGAGLFDLSVGAEATKPIYDGVLKTDGTDSVSMADMTEGSEGIRGGNCEGACKGSPDGARTREGGQEDAGQTAKKETRESFSSKATGCACGCKRQR